MSDLDNDNDVRQEERARLVNDSEPIAAQQEAAKKKKKRVLFGLIGLLLLIGIILAIVLPLTLKKGGGGGGDNGFNVIDSQEYNDYSVDKESIVETVFNKTFVLKTKASLQKKAKLAQGQAFMGLGDDGHKNTDYRPVNPQNIPSDVADEKNVNNHLLEEVKVHFDLVDNYNMRLFMHDNKAKDNEIKYVPQTLFPRPVISWESRLSQMNFKIEEETFTWNIGNIYSNNEILTTHKRKLFMSEKFSEVGFVLPSKRCYGLGQRNGQFQLQYGSYTLHSRYREDGLPTDNGLGDKSGNHIHPFVMCQTKDKDFMGMFFVSSAPQHFEIVSTDHDDRMILNYIVMGGPIEVYTIMRGKVDDIIAKYHGMIGYSMMPPFYALGMWTGSNSYNTLDKVKGVVSQFDNYALEGILLTNYNQLPHQTFTVNTDTYKGLVDYLKTLKNGNQHVILGASLAIQGNYDTFTAANDKKCLVQSGVYNGKNLIGIIDQTQVYYIDPLHKQTPVFLADQLNKFYDTVGGFEGLYLQDTHMPNQIAGEVDPNPPKPPSKEVKGRLLDVGSFGEEQLGNFQPYVINQDQKSYSTYNMPFQPTSNNLDYNTISLNSTQATFQENMMANLFIHNINGHAHLNLAYTTLKSQDKTKANKPLLLTDSTWAGSGAYGLAVVTDQMRTWDNLKNTISMSMGLSLYGVSNTMVDACGSLGKMDLELCSRWMQLSAFLPMVRNYFNDTYTDATGKKVPTDPLEPNAFEGDANFRFKMAYTSAISNRLPFLRYIYSQLYYAYRYGSAVVRPHFYEYFEDEQAFNNPEHTYMLGDSIKVSPVLQAGFKQDDQYDVYFPAGIWHDLNDYANILDLSKGGSTQKLKASDTNTNIHLKGGKIIPIQPNTQGLKTTKDFETKQKTSFIIARDAALKYAEGYVLIDDGISADSYDILPDNKQKFTYWKLRYAEKSINFWVQEGDFTYEPPAGYQIHMLQDITILNAEDLKDSDFACFLGLNLSPIALKKPAYNKDKKTLTIKPTMDHPDIKFNEIGFIKFGNSKTDQNFCDVQTFQYTVAKSDVTNDHVWTYDLAPKSALAILKPLKATFTQMDDIGTINVEITTQDDYNEKDPFKKLYRPPADAVFNPKKDQFFPTDKLTKKLSNFVIVDTTVFGYTIYKDASDKTTRLWRSDPTRLYISDFFVLDSGIFLMNQDDGFDQPLIGMGERAGDVFYKNQKGAIHSRKTFDQANPIDDGLPPGRNMYGYQPFYAFQSNNAKTKDWFGVFDLSSYATDYIVFSDIGNKETQIHKINIGGVISKYFFVGQKVDDLIKTYSKLVGFPTLPPIWAFGWQQCRFGWVTDQDWIDVYHNYTDPAIDLPLDTMWADIDYMDDYKLFTISQQSYKKLPDYVKEIKDAGLKFVPIMDAGVAVRINQGYKALDNGMDKKVFIKQDNKQDFLTAGVWCGNAYFPDFFKPETVAWWHDNFADLRDNQKLDFDGIWLDENEATNFCNGYCKPEERPGDSYRNKPFYVPGWRDLEDKAIGVDGWHDSIQRREYDVHNLFPLMQTKATAEYLISIKKRPYILSRSDFPGIGKYGHHWMGDNWSTVEYMALSVDGIFSYNLFALPFMGSDICGFNGDATNELCTRWHILGSLYPFARNHNQNASKSQEPYRFKDSVNATSPNVKFYDIIRSALVNRYHYVKYYYSSFFNIALEGGSYFKPLFYEYPLDPLAYQDLQVNILLGDALKVSMETTNLDFMTKESKRNYYFPKDRWCRIYPEIQNLAEDCFDSPGGANGYQNFVTTLESWYIHLRNGYVLPYQNFPVKTDKDHPTTVRRTGDLEKFPTDLYILPVTDNVPMTLSSTVSAVARGYLYFDDGISVIDADAKTNYAKFEFFMVKSADGKTFSISFNNVGGLKKSDTPKAHERLGQIKIFWASKSGVSAIKTATITTTAGAQAPINVVIDAKTETLTIPVSTDDKTFVLLWDITKIDLA